MVGASNPHPPSLLHVLEAVHLPWWVWVLGVVGLVVSAGQAELKRRRKAVHRRYLRSSAWKAQRRGALQRADDRCQDCGRPGPGLHVHHLTYKRHGQEQPEDLRVLCARCHARRHSPNRTPLDRLADRILD